MPPQNITYVYRTEAKSKLVDKRVGCIRTQCRLPMFPDAYISRINILERSRPSNLNINTRSSPT